MGMYGYARVSRDTDSDPLENQRIILVNAGVSADDIYEDADVSRSTLTEDREGWRRLMRKVNEDDIILTSDIDRVFGRVVDYAHTIEMLAEKSVWLREAVSTLEPEDKLGGGWLLGVLKVAVAEMEWEKSRVRHKASREKRRQRGLHVGRPRSYTRRQAERCHELRARYSDWSLVAIGAEVGLSPWQVRRALASNPADLPTDAFRQIGGRRPR